MKTKNQTVIATLVVSIAIATMVVPQVASAAWWNPLTWFQKSTVVPQVQVQTTMQVSVNASSTTPSDRLTQIQARAKEIDNEIMALFTVTNKATEDKNTDEFSVAFAKIQSLRSEKNVLQKEYTQLLADRTKTQVIGSQNQVEDIYNKYCVTPPSIAYKNTDYSDAYMKQLGDMPYADLENGILEGTYKDAKLPEALYYLGFKLTQAGQMDDSIRLYRCAAENYYDIQAMYRMASIYKSGTDELVKAIPNTVVKNRIAVDYNQAYYWIVSLIYSAKQEKTNFLDTSTQRGWNSIAMLDDLQNTSKVTGDMNNIEADVIKFIAKRYPSVSNLKESVGAHSLGGASSSTSKATSTKAIPVSASTSTPTGISIPISTSVLDSKPFVDTKNGYSITLPKGWKKTDSTTVGTLSHFVSDQDPKDLIDVAVGYTAAKSVQEFADTFIGLISKVAPDYSLIKNKKIIVSGLDAINFSFSYSDKGTPAVVSVIFIVKNNMPYNITARISKSNWEKMKSVIDSSLSTFKFN